jgi:hypothetical protein
VRTVVWAIYAALVVLTPTVVPSSSLVVVVAVVLGQAATCEREARAVPEPASNAQEHPRNAQGTGLVPISDFRLMVIIRTIGRVAGSLEY